MNSYRKIIYQEGRDAADCHVDAIMCPYHSGWQRDAWFEGFRDFKNGTRSYP